MRSDFEVTVRVRNNQLKSRRDELGFSQAQMAAAVGIAKQQYQGLESMREHPLTSKGHWRGVALALASFFDVMPDDLFPPDVLGIKSNVSTRTANASEVIAITNGSSRIALPASKAYDNAELSACLGDSISTLSAKERTVIDGRFYEDKTLEEIGQDMFLTKDAVRQIEEKALRKLRHPSRSKVLRPFIHDNVSN